MSRSTSGGPRTWWSRAEDRVLEKTVHRGIEACLAALPGRSAAAIRSRAHGFGWPLPRRVRTRAPGSPPVNRFGRQTGPVRTKIDMAGVPIPDFHPYVPQATHPVREGAYDYRVIPSLTIGRAKP